MSRNSGMHVAGAVTAGLMLKASLPGALLVVIVAVMAFNYRKLRQAPGVGALLYIVFLAVFLGMVIWQGSVLQAGVDIDVNGPHAQYFLILFLAEMTLAIRMIMYIAFTSK